tara:strand:+ start:34 stop:282 length:249 start_codon:yes stop_codon:yes gene_type:complete
MEKYFEIIHICKEVSRPDLADFLEDLLSGIKEALDDVEDGDFSECDASSEEEEDLELGIEESEFKVKIDEQGFWSFEFSDEE